MLSHMQVFVHPWQDLYETQYLSLLLNFEDCDNRTKGEKSSLRLSCSSWGLAIFLWVWEPLCCVYLCQAENSSIFSAWCMNQNANWKCWAKIYQTAFLCTGGHSVTILYVTSLVSFLHWTLHRLNLSLYTFATFCYWASLPHF